jgi:hypothetical protein
MKAVKRARPKPAKRIKRVRQILPPPPEDLMVDGEPLFTTPIERF